MSVIPSPFKGGPPVLAFRGPGRESNVLGCGRKCNVQPLDAAFPSRTITPARLFSPPSALVQHGNHVRLIGVDVEGVRPVVATPRVPAAIVIGRSPSTSASDQNARRRSTAFGMTNDSSDPCISEAIRLASSTVSLTPPLNVGDEGHEYSPAAAPRSARRSQYSPEAS